MRKEILFLTALASCLSSFGQTFEKTAQGGKFQTAQPTLNGEVIFYSPRGSDFLLSFYCAHRKVSFG